MRSKRFIAPFLCTLLEHYDKMLFSLSIPFLTPLFFSDKDPVNSLIWGYALMPIGALSRPLGAWIFGQIGDRYGRRQALIISSLGIAAATATVALLPTYAQIGILAPALLGACRFAQNLFFPGQTTGGALIVLENSSDKKGSLLSSCYQSIGELGSLIAATAIALLAYYGAVESYWRYLFLVGALIGLVAFFVRSPADEEIIKRPKSNFRDIRNHIPRFILAALMSGFAYGNLMIITTLLNGFAPIVANVSRTQMIHVSSWVIGINMILMPGFGWLCTKIGRDRVMLFGALSLAMLAPFAFTALQGASLSQVIAVRMLLLVLGSAVTAPFYFWMKEIAPEHCRFTFIGLAKAAGLQIFGAPASMLCLWIYRASGSLALSGMYYSLISLGACFAIIQAGRIRAHEQLIASAE